MLSTADKSVKHKALFCLSNVAGSVNLDHKNMLIEEEMLVERVIQLTENDYGPVQIEALWVLTNLITMVEPEQRA